MNPDSASSRPARRLGSGTTRRTEKTAAASVLETIAPNNRANCQSTPRTRWVPNSGHRRADDNPDYRENGRRGKHFADIPEPGGQAALDEDCTQRRRAKVLRELGVVELDAPTRFPRE